jgi:pSer/pThr/pTyr-binding forkhead associated (FHA) protein
MTGTSSVHAARPITGITIRVLDGADRGRVFNDLTPPITIGREEGNTIQLNDERVSRFHVKIQEDHNRLVITDLESTNGTKVNGEDVQLRILRYGDMIHLGRSVLLFGSRDQIAQRLARLRADDPDGSQSAQPEQPNKAANISSLDFELNWSEDADLQATIHALEPPELPERLTPGQAAQLAELLEFLHLRLRNLIGSVHGDSKSSKVTLELRQWQALIDMQSRLAEYLRQVGEP